MVQNDKHVETPVSVKVVRRVAAVTDQEVAQLPPLYDAVDPEALDSLLESVANPSSLEIRITYAGRRVIIDGRGAVSVEE